MARFTNNEAWEAKLAELVAYKEVHGDCRVPRTYEANKKLGRWVMRQRTEYRLFVNGKMCSMT